MTERITQAKVREILEHLALRKELHGKLVWQSDQEINDLALALEEFAVALRDSMEDTTPEQDREHRALVESYFEGDQLIMQDSPPVACAQDPQ